MVPELREDYIDHADRLREATPTKLNPFVRGVTTPTTSVNLTTSFSQPVAPFLDDVRSMHTGLNEDLASDIQSVRTNAELQEELMQSMHSMSLLPREHAVSNEIPSIFECEHTGGSKLPSVLPQDKHFFILSSAGKPIFSMHGRDELVMGLMGIVHTVLSYFQLQNSKIHSITTGSPGKTKQKFVFLDKTPILLMAMTSREETTSDLLQQLDFLYSYLVSTLSRKQLTRLFSKRENFDLRNFLTHTDFYNLNHICDSISNGFHPDLLLGALRCLMLRKSTRRALHTLMLTQLQDPEVAVSRGTLLYGLIVAPGNQLCSVLRPKGHTLHTTDLHLLFSLVFNQFQSLQDDQELWVPICFPKFNSNGFLHCYIKLLPRSPSINISYDSLLTDQNRQQEGTQLETTLENGPSSSQSSLNDGADSPQSLKVPYPPRSALVLISAQKESFFALKGIGQKIVDQLKAQDLLNQINAACETGFSMSDIPAPLVHHFIYKSKKHVQYVMPQLPVLEDPAYSELSDLVDQNLDEEEILHTNPELSTTNSQTEPVEVHDRKYDNGHNLYLKKLMHYYTHIRNNAVGECGRPFNRSTLTFVKWKNDAPLSDNLPQEEVADILCLAWLTPTFELYLICNNGVTDRNTVLKSAKNIVAWCRKHEGRLFVSDGAIF
ncbi:LAFE_0C06766g1_1 [Lachancea fermentati]|uniref:Vacuolar fusion protein MON1 n=1 Tax=Lachancea fermentati TaxID=4955 RepID=A0A1G4M9X3_LACFM|nr:LAFE_0C06766g1_1 [Lachancea fermentati]